MAHTLYMALRKRMELCEATQADIADRLAISKTTLSHKMNAKVPWKDFEMYVVMDYLGIEPEDMYLYFPRNGMEVQNKKRTKADAYLRQIHKGAVGKSSMEALKTLVDGMYEECMG